MWRSRQEGATAPVTHKMHMCLKLVTYNMQECTNMWFKLKLVTHKMHVRFKLVTHKMHTRFSNWLHNGDACNAYALQIKTGDT